MGIVCIKNQACDVPPCTSVTFYDFGDSYINIISNLLKKKNCFTCHFLYMILHYLSRLKTSYDTICEWCIRQLAYILQVTRSKSVLNRPLWDETFEIKNSIIRQPSIFAIIHHNDDIYKPWFFSTGFQATIATIVVSFCFKRKLVLSQSRNIRSFNTCRRSFTQICEAIF